MTVTISDVNKNHRIRILDHLYRFCDFEKRRNTSYIFKNYNLNNIRKLLNRLGNPQKYFRSFHVAGSKGKGTITHLMAYLLEAMGYYTGHTVSPHLIDERDRFYIQGHKTTWEEIIPVMEDVLEAVDKLVEINNCNPTLFDIFTAVAFLFFYRSKIDIAIIETGLGGRWDSTNCLESSDLIACLISLIDYDHMDKLGSTLPLIAEEKAGIIKDGIPVFTINANPGVIEVLRKHSFEKGSSIYFFGNKHQDFSPLLKENIILKKTTEYIPEPTLSNLNLAISCLTTLGYPLSQKHVREVMNRLPIPGRYHKIENLLIDGAHTPSSLRALVSDIRLDPWTMGFKTIKIFFYCLYDKDTRGMVREIPLEWDMSFFDCDLHYVDFRKVLDVKEMINKVRKKTLNTVKSLAEIKWREHPQVLHIFTGSFRLVGKILGELEELDKE